jgi:hypothetical protein
MPDASDRANESWRFICGFIDICALDPVSSLEPGYITEKVNLQQL